MKHGIGQTCVRARRTAIYAYGVTDQRNTDRSPGQFIRLKPCAKCGCSKINLDKGVIIHFTNRTHRYWCDRCGFKGRSHHQVAGAKNLWNAKQKRMAGRKKK